MNCEEFEGELNELLDQRAPLHLSGAAADHVSSCAACRGLLSAHETTIEVVHHTQRPAPSSECGQAVPARFVAARRRRRIGLALSIVASASVVFAALLSLDRDREPSPPEGGRVAEQRPSPEPRSPQSPEGSQSPEVPEESLAELADEAHQSYLALAEQTETDLADAMRLFPTSSSGTAVDPAEAVQAPPESNLTSRMTSGFEPLARSTAGAVKFLFGVVPGAAETPENGESL